MSTPGTVGADTVAGIARAVPGVVDLHTGGYGEIATYLPGRRVAGVRINGSRIEIHIVASTTTPLRDTARATADAVTAAFPDHTVDVFIGDVATPEAPHAETAPLASVPTRD
jgi:hypothetical protein